MYRNAEGYNDPTLGAVMQKMMTEYNAEQRKENKRKTQTCLYRFKVRRRYRREHQERPPLLSLRGEAGIYAPRKPSAVPAVSER